MERSLGTYPEVLRQGRHKALYLRNSGTELAEGIGNSKAAVIRCGRADSETSWVTRVLLKMISFLKRAYVKSALLKATRCQFRPAADLESIKVSRLCGRLLR